MTHTPPADDNPIPDAKGSDAVRFRRAFARGLIVGLIPLFLFLLLRGEVIYGATGGDALFIDPSGRVGIGTDQPKAQLDVKGDVRISGNVGIGTPNQKGALDVEGGTLIKGALGIKQTDPTRAGVRIDDDKGGNATIELSARKDGPVLYMWPTGTAGFGVDPKSLQNQGVSLGVNGTAKFQKVKISSQGVLGSTPAEGALNVSGNVVTTGSIKSPMWNVTRIFDRKAGPLPVERNFTSKGGTLIIFVTGTAWRNSVGLMNLVIRVNGGHEMWIDLWTNEIKSHKSFPTIGHVVQGLPAGKHTLKIDGWTKDTKTDGNDRFYATVLELPF